MHATMPSAVCSTKHSGHASWHTITSIAQYHSSTTDGASASTPTTIVRHTSTTAHHAGSTTTAEDTTSEVWQQSHTTTDVQQEYDQDATEVHAQTAVHVQTWEITHGQAVQTYALTAISQVHQTQACALTQATTQDQATAEARTDQT